MSRVARVVIPEVPHHITQRRNRLLEMFGKWDDFLSRGLSDEEVDEFRCHERTGRPLGADSFIARLETVLERILRRQKLGSKGTQKKNGNSQN